MLQTKVQIMMCPHCGRKDEDDMSQHDTKTDLETLERIEQKLFAFRYAMEVVGMNGDTIDPPTAAEGRGEALALLEEEYIALLCAPSTGELLERLAAQDLDEMQAAQVKVLSRDRALQVDVPPAEQAALTKLINEATHVWHLSKPVNDWDAFEPYLDKLVEAQRRIALIRKPAQDPYDTMLQDFEPGTDRTSYDAFFDAVKDQVVPLVGDIVARGWQPDRSCIEGNFDEAKQKELATELARLIGVRLDSLHIADTEHPFEGSPTSQQSIIANHVYEDNLFASVFSMLHEGGHALYDQGVNPAYDYTCLQSGTSSGMHESQSRFFENIVGRSEAFMPVLISTLEKFFPGRFANTDPRELYCAVNRAEPGLIRIEADELTYPLHIIVRYEIERLLVAGEASAKDVPGLWAEKMHQYLGVDVPDHSRGALQDVHWSGGSFGYFPSYALGSAYSSQFKDRMVELGMDFDAVLASGDLQPIRDWLSANVWTYGRGKDPDEIIPAACGAPFDPSHYTNYLVKKFSDIYGLGA